jgi:predicted transport protein
MAKSPAEMEAAMVANFPEKTGKPLEQWLALVKKGKLAKHGEIVAWLKDEHGMGHGFANLVAHRHLNPPGAAPAGDDLVAAQYAGKKEALKPLYDTLAAAVAKFGPDVVFEPKKAYVSLRRSKQFGLIQPSTATRLDVGIQLKGVAPTARLEASGSFSAMVSHRVRVESAADIDAELVGWLKQAYQAS